MSPKSLRLIAALLMFVGFVSWMALILISKNLALANLSTLAPASGLFALFMIRAKQKEDEVER